MSSPYNIFGGLDYTTDSDDFKIKPHHFGIKKCGFMNREQFKNTFCVIEYFLYRCSCGDDGDNIKMRQLIDDPTYQANIVVIISHKVNKKMDYVNHNRLRKLVEYICVDIKLDGIHIGHYFTEEFSHINDIYLLDQLEIERLKQIKININEFILKKINKHIAQELLYQISTLDNYCIDKVLSLI